uniref:Helicase-primase helicase subunit n=1 Tax=Lake sturgeon herpesvirus TaxID=2922427 RepID=A0A9E9GKN6_9VIRU|nr:helicase-primase helicase subunit [Lake sturgeon herpesvirus]
MDRPAPVSDALAENPDSDRLTRYAHYTQEAWVDSILDLYFASPNKHLLVLAGDAGTGKTHALCMLNERFRELNLRPPLFTATTKNAAGVLKCGSTTYHSALGINNQALLQASTVQEFMTLYRAKYRDFYALFDQCVAKSASLASLLEPSGNGVHQCQALNVRCHRCSRTLHKALSKCGFVPPVAYTPVMVIDEYGMLDRLSLEKILAVLDSVSLPGQGHLIIMCGSITQLPPARVSNNNYVCQSPDWAGLFLHCQYLRVNHRQKADPAYGLSMGLFQFNVVTPQAVSLLNSRVLPELTRVYDPSFMPHALRIFNDNSSRDSYNSAAASLCANKKFSLPNRLECGSGDIKRFTAELTDRFRLVFSATSNDRVFYLGSRVWLIKCSQIKASDPTRGTVTKFSKDTLYVTCDNGTAFELSKEIYTSSLYTKCVAHFYPVALAHAINTYSAQGESLSCDVIYVPPLKAYFRSELTASAYVACTRVCRRSKLFLAANSFASAPGQAQFFKPEVLKFKKQWEMGYQPTCL